MVIVGIGIVPAVEPLLAAGAEGGNGVAVVGHCRTTLPDVYAIGDCALHANAFASGLPIRLESVENANDMAATVSRAITGQPETYHAVPWFWSNQYDLKRQTVGLSTGHDDEILRGDPAALSFSIIYLKAGRVVALDCVNAVKEYVQGRALVIGAHTPDPACLADTGRPLKDLVVASATAFQLQGAIPMPSVFRLAYVDLATTSIDEAVEYYSGVLGSMLVDRDGDSAYLSLGLDHHNISLRTAERAGLDAIGLQLGAGVDVGELERRLEAMGLSVASKSDARPGVPKLLEVVNVGVTPFTSFPKWPRQHRGSAGEGSSRCALAMSPC